MFWWAVKCMGDPFGRHSMSGGGGRGRSCYPFPMQTSDPPVQLSRRVRALKPSATLVVTARAAELRAAGRDIISFGLGEPDFDTPADIKEAAIDALRKGATHYMPVAGEAGARRAVAEKLRRENGIECTPEDVIITTGAKHAIYLALQCLLDPGQGQEVLLPTPAWVSFRPMIELAGGNVVELPSSLDNDFKITPLQLEQAINGRTAAIIINSPSNPCGTMYDPDELKALGEVLAGHEGVTLICDEIYEKLVFGGIRHFSPGSLPAIAGRVVTINGLGKAYAMTGWRIGYAAAPGDGRGGGSALIRAMIKLQGQTTTNVTSFCYAAVTQALTRGAASIERMRQAFADRAGVIFGLLGEMPGLRCARPTGAFYAFPDVSSTFGRRSPEGREIDSSIAFAEALLEEAGVAVVPGSEFGDCGEGHVRISFACSDEHIREGCRRIDAWLRRL